MFPHVLRHHGPSFDRRRSNMLTRGLVAYWNFDEADGGPYADELSRTTAIDWTENGTIGKGEGRPGEGVTLDSTVTSDLRLTYAKLSAAGNTDVLLTTQDWTISFAFYLSAFTNGDRLFSTNQVAAGAGLSTLILTGPVLNIRLEDDLATVSQGSFSQNLVVGAWNHVILRHTHGVQTEFVLNGAPASDIRDTSGITGSLDDGLDWRIGSGSQSPDGTVDSLGRWNRLLTDYECGLLYNNGFGLSYRL